MQMAVVLEGDMRYKNLVYSNGGSCRGVMYGSADANVGIIPSIEKTGLNLKIYPNPTPDFITIEAGEQLNSVSIYDLLGKKLKDFYPESCCTTVSVADLKSGFYLVRAATKTGYQVVEILKN
jgi:hypothetical protein